MLAAAKNDDLEEVNRLLALGADPDASVSGHTVDPRDGATFTALVAAAAGSRDRIVEALLTAGASTHCIDDGKCCPLLRAAQNKNLNVIRMLLASGADLDHTNFYGATPLHVAAAGGFAEGVRVLMAAGADPTIRLTGYDLDLPIEAAYKQGHLEVVKLLGGALDPEFEKQKALREAAEEGDMDEVRKYLDSAKIWSIDRLPHPEWYQPKGDHHDVGSGGGKRARFGTL